MATVKEAVDVMAPSLQERALVGAAAVEELVRARKRIAELEANAKGRPSLVGTILSGLLRAVVAGVAIVGLLAVGHRLLLWGFP